jgi:hypothetical protein
MSKSKLSSAILFLVVLQIFSFAAFGQMPTGKTVSHTIGKMEIRIFFVNTRMSTRESDCAAGEWVTREIPATKKVADAALRQVFRGPTAAEKKRGMQSISQLAKFYIGVTIRSETAIVNFRPGAERYLYVGGPICMRETSLAPMTKTLKQFPRVNDVEYAIDGKIIGDWDA